MITVFRIRMHVLLLEYFFAADHVIIATVMP